MCKQEQGVVPFCLHGGLPMHHFAYGNIFSPTCAQTYCKVTEVSHTQEAQGLYKIDQQPNLCITVMQSGHNSGMPTISAGIPS